MFFQLFSHKVPQQSDSTPSATIPDIPTNNPSDADEIPSTASEQILTSNLPATVQLKDNVALAARHTVALDVYNDKFYSFATYTQKSLYT